MAIEIGARITAISQRSLPYQDQGAPATLHIRDVSFEVVGMPDAVQPKPVIHIPVTDATQWNTLQIDQTCTITITPP